MNTILLNTVSLDGGTIIKKGSGGGGVTIKNQEKSLEITENGVTEVAPDSGFTGLSKVVVNTNVASSGGGATEPKPVNDVTFYDYDGVVLYSYTKDEFLAMSEMPPLPTRKGLICQEWNWDYEDAIAYVSEYGILDVGATYITDDGKTRIYITIASEGRMAFKLYFYQSLENGVKIDWGDGSPIESGESTGSRNYYHTYQKVGNYCISLEIEDGCNFYFGRKKSDYSLIGSYTTNRACYGMVKKIEFGKNIHTIASYTMSDSFIIESITIPNGVTIIENYALASNTPFVTIFPKNISFSHPFDSSRTKIGKVVMPNTLIDAFALIRYADRRITIPNVSALLQNAFFESDISNIVIPNSITSVGANVFNACRFLTSVRIPKSILTISSGMFSSCNGMAFYDFSKHESVPILEDVSAFSSIPSDCKIIVPDALYDEWKAATNWSTYASYIIKKSDWDASQS